ncbi:unnamed protein product [marine sediment metagenome]|uniref:Uncharacterized protein n=1 Tax=marine sediment metagenome TaxID=412755 RepID=X1SX23_9ZZZZ
MITDYEKLDPNLFVKEADVYKLDRTLDELALIINNTEPRLVVVLGCAHRVLSIPCTIPRAYRYKKDKHGSGRLSPD